MELDYTDAVVIKITKVKFEDEPTHWEVEMTNFVGDEFASATGPTFGGMLSFVSEVLDDEGWTSFDANGDNK
jgi:hypothetical protein